MTNTLPPSLGTSSHPIVTRHAQDMSVATLKQHKERSSAAVSMASARHARRETKAATSIHRYTDSSPEKRGEDSGSYTEEEREEIRTRLRYRHIRQMIKDRQEAEKRDKKTDG